METASPPPAFDGHPTPTPTPRAESPIFRQPIMLVRLLFIH